MMIAITMGDANGVGPEIILKAFRDGEIPGQCVVVGDYQVLRHCGEMIGIDVPLHPITSLEEYQPGVVNVWDRGLLSPEDITPGKRSQKVGAASRDYVAFAAQKTLEGVFDAVVTLPVNKEAIRLSDPGFTGHTELIADICGQKEYTMMLSSSKLTVTHVSTHVSMLEAVRNVQKDRIVMVARLTHEALVGKVVRPRIAVAGLNAHAGEGGAFGREELDEIIPAVQQCQQMGMDVTGPYPPDTIFLRASRGEFDAVEIGRAHV